MCRQSRIDARPFSILPRRLTGPSRLAGNTGALLILDSRSTPRPSLRQRETEGSGAIDGFFQVAAPAVALRPPRRGRRRQGHRRRRKPCCCDRRHCVGIAAAGAAAVCTPANACAGAPEFAKIRQIVGFARSVPSHPPAQCRCSPNRASARFVETGLHDRVAWSSPPRTRRRIFSTNVSSACPQVAPGADARHSGAAVEGMQLKLHSRLVCLSLRSRFPGGQRAVRASSNSVAFFA